MPGAYDVKREHPLLYAPRNREFAVVDVPPLLVAQIDGHGDPNTSDAYAGAVRTLYTASYAARAIAKSQVGRVHTVGPLEALWSADDPAAFVARAKSSWDWTVMIAQPEWIDEEIRSEALAAARRKGAPAVDLLRFTEFHEGPCVQVLHIGPYDDEGPVLAALHDEYMPAHGLTWNGRHHEIYLSDPRRTAPDKLRTVLRQPVRPVGQTGAAAGSSRNPS